MIEKGCDDLVAEFPLSAAEYSILSSVKLAWGSLTLDKLPAYAEGMVDIHSPASHDRYSAAATVCLDRGLIRVLTLEDCKQDRKRWRGDDNQFCSELEYVAGNVDFTSDAGLRFFQMEMQCDVRQGRLPFAGTLGFAWRFPKILKVFAAHESDLLQELNTLNDSEAAAQLLNKREIVSIDPPEQIGPWWLNRFTRLPVGYTAKIHYYWKDRATRIVPVAA